MAMPMAQYPKGTDPEDQVARDRRFQIIAEAVNTVVRNATCQDVEPEKKCVAWWPSDQGDRLAAMLVTLAWYESKFMLRIHESRCNSDECDSFTMAGGQIGHRARSLWQVHFNPYVVSKQDWEGLRGSSLEATTKAATAAARVLVAGRAGCARGRSKGWEYGAVSAYATGSSCKWSGASDRVKTYRGVLKRMAEASVASPAPALPSPPAPADLPPARHASR